MLLCSATMLIQANPVDVKTANSIALNFIKSQAQKVNAARGMQQADVVNDVELNLVYEPASETGFSEYYVFAPSNSAGFVIVSGDDKVNPIVGYSLTGNFAADNMSPALENLLSSYANYVDEVRDGNVEPVAQTEAEITPVEPLITTKWDQLYPYNCYCPQIGGQATVVGCNATALAQILKYHEWPNAGHGKCYATLNDGNNTEISITLGEEYDWDNMKDSYASDYTEAEVQAVGLLMRDAGYATNLQYGVDVTRGYAITVPIALFNNFDYSPSICLVDKSYYSEAKWKEMLYNELSSSRPIWYCGENDGGGHSFVCCGIDESGAYYINWGWGGYNDGYYNLNSFVSSGGSYNNWQKAIIGVKPIADNEKAEDYIALPHIGRFEITNQNTSLSSPSVDFSIWVSNLAVRTVSGHVGYAVYENGNMLSPEIEVMDNQLYELSPGYYVQSGFRLELDDIANASQEVKEIRLFWRSAGSNEWQTPLGDQCIYMKNTGNGYTFFVEEEVAVPEQPAAVINDGNYYLKNVATGEFLTASNDWGTRASVGEHGLDFTISRNNNGKYIIESRIGTNEKYFLGQNTEGLLYVDVEETEWVVEKLDNGNYVFRIDGVSAYMGYYAGTIVSNITTDPLTDEKAQWQLFTRDDLMAELSKASANKPVDATFLIVGAGFGRVDTRNYEWQGGLEVGGWEPNFCAQKYDVATYDLYQTLTGLPNGLYELNVQGFYREGGEFATPEKAYNNFVAGESELNAILYANNETVPLVSIISEAQEGEIPNPHFSATPIGYVPQDMYGASQCFIDGLYPNTLQVEVTDGTLRFGVRKDAESIYDWACFDNFELYYYGSAQSVNSDIDLLDSQTEFVNNKSGVYENLTYTRNFLDTHWQALYVPFDIPYENIKNDFVVADINNVHQYDNNDDGIIDDTVIEAFKVTGGVIKANYPYLIRSKGVGKKVIALIDAMLYVTEENSVDCSSVHEKFTFTGTYKSMSSNKLPQGNGYYTLVDGKWLPVAANTTLGAFRFYLKVDSRTADTVARTGSIRMKVIGDDEQGASVEEITTEGERYDIYDLQGRRVYNPTKGIYIINGCKVLINNK